MIDAIVFELYINCTRLLVDYELHSPGVQSLHYACLFAAFFD